MKIGRVKFPQVGPQTRALTARALAARGIRGPIFVFVAEYRVAVEIDGWDRTLVVPEGFETDWASVPLFARMFLSDDNRWLLEPSVVHDLIYERQGRVDPYEENLGRADADEILRLGMIECGCPAPLARLVFLALRVGGSTHWKPSPK